MFLAQTQAGLRGTMQRSNESGRREAGFTPSQKSRRERHPVTSHTGPFLAAAQTDVWEGRNSQQDNPKDETVETPKRQENGKNQSPTKSSSPRTLTARGLRNAAAAADDADEKFAPPETKQQK